MCRSSSSKARDWGCDLLWDKGNPNEDMRQNLTAIYRVSSEPWVTDGTWTVHIPVSNRPILANNYYGFSRVILDSEFPKPPSDEVGTTPLWVHTVLGFAQC